MSIIVELLKANAVSANHLVVNANSAIKLAVGDLLKVEQTEGVSAQRQGLDLVLTIDPRDGGPAERVVVTGFFAPGSLGMVQIGPDGAAEMVTPRTAVLPSSVETAAQGDAPQPVLNEEQIDGQQYSANLMPQLFQDLGVNDTAGGNLSDLGGADRAQDGLAGLLEGVGGGDVPLDALREVTDYSTQNTVSTGLFAAPVVGTGDVSGWINALDRQQGYVLSGLGADGCDVRVTFEGAKGTVTRLVAVQSSTWQLTLSSDEITLLGEGRLVVTAQNLSSDGQLVSAAGSLVLGIDTLVPAVPEITLPLSLSSDGTLSATDVAGDVRFTIRAEAGSLVTMTLTDTPDHTLTLTGVAGADGLCVLDVKPLLAELVDGLIIYRVTSQDAAGNTSSTVEPSFSLHQNVPDAPVATMLAVDDHGRFDNDGVTNVTTPHFSGTVTGITTLVRVYRDAGTLDGLPSSSELVATVIPVDGTFSYQATSLAGTQPGDTDGAYRYLFVAEDVFGNRSTPTPVNLTLDTVVAAPVLDVVATDDRLSYTELLESTVAFSGSAEPLSTVTLIFAQGNTNFRYTATANAAGHWSVDVYSNVTGDVAQAQSLRYGFGTGFNGFVEVSAQQTDLAGNVSGLGSKSIYLRTEPVQQVTSLGFGIGTSGQSDDTGASSTDGVTKLTRFQVTGVGPASDIGNSNMVVRVYADTNGNGSIEPDVDVLLAELRTDAGGTFSGLVPDLTKSALAQGEYTLRTVVYDELSGTTSSASGIRESLRVVVDTQVGKVTFDDIAGADNIITANEFSAGTILVSGHGEAGAKVDLVFDSGTTNLTQYQGLVVDSTGRWSAQVLYADIVSLGSSATATLRAVQTDLAGNKTALTDSIEKVFQIRLEQLVGPGAFALVAADDTGVSSIDGITSKSLGVTFAGTATAGNRVVLFRDANQDGVLDAGETLGSVLADANGAFSVVVNLPVGASQIRAQSYDDAGQTSGASAAITVMVDQTIAAPQGLKVTPDNIINAEEATANSATLSGTGESGATVELEVYSGTTRVFVKSVVANSQGVWLTNLTNVEVGALQAAGGTDWLLRARQVDKAGNTSAFAEQSFVIDTAAPLVPNLDNNAAADAYNNDVLRPWRSGNGSGQLSWAEIYSAEGGFARSKTLQVAVALLADVQLNDTINMVWGAKSVSHIVTAEDIARGFAKVDIAGSLIERNKLDSSQSIISVSATFVDVAGNESASVSVMTGVDAGLLGAPPTLVPAVGSFATFDAANSIYYSRNSSTSSDADRTTFGVTGIANAGDTVVVFNDVNLDGVAQNAEILAIVTADTQGSYSASLSLLPGQTNLRALSSNVTDGGASNVQFVVVDVLEPLPPQLSSTVIAVDNRVGAAERDAGIALSGTAEPFATLNIQLLNMSTGVTGSIARTVTADASGNWTATIGVVQWGQVGDGNIEVRVSQSDRAGNTSDVFLVNGQVPTVVFDTQVAPPTIFQVGSDGIISAVEAATTTVFRGGGEPGATMVLTFTGANGVIGPVSTTVDNNGLWAFTLSSAQVSTGLGNGQLSIAATQTDLAGNQSARSTRVVVVDTQAFAPQIAVVSGDNIINAGEAAVGVAFSGSAEPGASVTVRLVGTSGQQVTKTVLTSDTGTWNTNLNGVELSTLGQGNCTVFAKQTDLAGNVSVDASRTIEIATAPLGTPVSLNPVTGLDNQVSVAEQFAGITLQGTAPANTTLHLTLTGVRGILTRDIAVGASGAWSMPLDKESLQGTLGAGEVFVTAYADNTQQQSTGLLAEKFAIDTEEPSASLSRVASDNYVNARESGAAVTLEGGGEPGHVVQLTIAGQNGGSSLSLVVGADRKWSTSLSVGDIALLGNGLVTVSMVQMASNAPGAASSITTRGSFIIDTVAPGVPNASDTSVANSFNNLQSEIAGGVTVAEAANGVVVGVALPNDVQAGDRFVVHWGDQEVTQLISAAMVPANGSRVVYMTVPEGTLINQGDGSFDITVTFTDIAGNTSSAQLIASQLTVKAPPSAPTLNTVYADGYINAVEFAGIQTTGTGVISGNAQDGGTIAINLKGASGQEVNFLSVPVVGGAWTVQFTPAQLLLLGEGSITTKVFYTNATGSISAPAQLDFVFDKTASLAPALDSVNSIAANEANARNELAGGLIRSGNAVTEAASAATVNVALAPDVRSGDTLTLLWGNQLVNSVVNQSDISRGYMQVLVSSFVISTEGDNDALQVRARVTDKAGNVGATYAVWTGKVDAIPLSPEVNAVEGNGYVNTDKAVAWSVNGSGVRNGKVVVTLLGTKIDPATGQLATIVSPEIAVTENGLGGFTWNYGLNRANADFLGEGRIKITSIQYDESRNPSDPGKNPSDPSIRFFTIDLTPPAAPTIDDVTANNSVSFSEGKSDVVISGTAESGSTVSVTISHGVVSYQKTASVVDGAWSVVLSADEKELEKLGGGAVPISVAAKVTDAAGNESALAQHGFLYTTTAITAPTFTAITGVTAGVDANFTLADLQTLGTTPFTVSGTGTVGYDVRLGVQSDSGARFSYLVRVDGNGVWSRTFTLSEFNGLGQGSVLFTAAQIDPSGDESVLTTYASGAADNAVLIDTVPPTLASVLVAGGGLNGNAKAGDVITLTVQASERMVLTGMDALHVPTYGLNFGNGQTRVAVYDAAKTALAGVGQLVFTYVVQAGDSATTVTPAAAITLNSVILSDASGNTTGGTIAPGGVTPAILRVDTVVPAALGIVSVDAVALGTPGQMLDSGGNTINKLNIQEAAAGVKVRVNVAVGSVLGGTSPQVGDQVEVSWISDGNTTRLTKQLLPADISAGFVDVTVGRATIGSFDGAVTLTTRLIDAAGNASPDSAQTVILVDTVAPVAMDFSTWLTDNKVNALEASSQILDLSLKGLSLERGATVTARLVQGSTSINFTTTAVGTSGDWAISSAQLRSGLLQLADGTFQVIVSQTDAAGNPSVQSTANYYIDRVVPNKPTITSVPQNADGWVNLRDAQTVGVKVVVSLLGTNAVVGDDLVLSGFTTEYHHTITAPDLTAQIVTLTLPASVAMQALGESAAPGRVLNARVEDQGGNISDQSVNFAINLDTNVVAPQADMVNGVAGTGVSKSQAKEKQYFKGLGVEAGANVSVYFTGVLGTTLLSTTVGNATGTFTVALDINDMASLGDGPVNYRISQTDVALNLSPETLGAFDLRLSTPLPILLNMTEDNVVSADEASQLTTNYNGLGVVGATVTLNFYVRDSQGVYKTSPEIAAKTALVDSAGKWSVKLSNTDFIALSAAGQGTVEILATQDEQGSVSGVADLEFYVDRLAPSLLVSTNLLTQTQAFENAAWTKSNTSAVANTIAAPDGTLTADSVIVNFGTFGASVSQPFAIKASTTYTYSVYLKAGALGLPWVELTSSGDATVRQWFNVQTGTVGASSSASIKSPAITPVGDGWYRASFTYTSTAAATGNNTFTIFERPNNNSTAAVTGDGIKVGVYVWGAQVEVGAVGTPPSAYKPLTSPLALSLFDGNGDGANNDGLLVTFAEPVSVIELTKTTAYTATTGKTMGKDFRIEAVDSRSINGQFYATQFKLFLDTDSTMVKGNTITVSKNSIVDAGGNKATLDQVLTMPDLVVPGLPTPPVDIMSDNRINLEEASNVTRLTYSDLNSAAQLKLALGGLLQTKVNGVVADEVIPKANFLIVDLTLGSAAKLLQGQNVSAVVRVTFLDNTTKDITVYATGTAGPTGTETVATNKYRYTSKETVDLSNVSDISYRSASTNGFFVPQTVDPTGLTSSGLKVTSTVVGAVTTSTVTLTLDFPNTMHLASGKQSAATVRVYFTDQAVWQDVLALSPVGTAATASTGFTRMTYTVTVDRPIGPSNNFFWEVVPTNLTLDSTLAVQTTGVNAPVITTRLDTSVVVKTTDLVDGAPLTTQLLDKNLNPIAGTLETLSYSASNPNRVLYTQSLTDALAASGRKLQMFVDGVAVGTPTTMGIDTLSFLVYGRWENQYGVSSGWGDGSMALQAGNKITARLTVTFKSIGGVIAPPVEVVVTCVGGQRPVGNDTFEFTGQFVNAATGQVIDSRTVASIAYKANSISEFFPNAVMAAGAITTSQYVDLPASAWAGQTDGLKQIMAQVSTADGALSSVFSAPKQIRLDQSVGGIKDVSLMTDLNNNNALDAGDTLVVRFTESVAFTFSALPAAFGTNPVVTPIGTENGYSQMWTIKLGANASIKDTLASGQDFDFRLEARKVFDAAGNDNGSAVSTPTTGTVAVTIMSKAGTPVIDNVSGDNVIDSTAAATSVTVNLTKAAVGDVVKLFMDGVEVGSKTLTAGQTASISFDVAGRDWGADGERALTTSITRGAMTTTSALRSVYVAADSSHWSLEAKYANKIHWFNPDAITQADGTLVTSWAASRGGMTVANTVANSKTYKITDVLTGHSYLVLDATSAFYETKVGTSYLYTAVAANVPTMAKFLGDTTNPTAGFTDFSMFKPTVNGSQNVMVHPIYRYTSNAAAVTYIPGNVVNGQSVTVQPYTLLMRNQTLSYNSNGVSSNVNLYDYSGWNTSMVNSISVGSWQLVTEADVGYTLSSYNQMRFNQSLNYGGYTPNATNTLTSYDYTTLSIDDARRRFQIGGGGTGVLGDQISITVATGLAYQQEIGAYLAAKFQSTGAVVARNADVNNNTYDLTVSNVPGTLIDQNLALNDRVSNDIVITAGADYVNTGAGNDIVMVKDFALRHIDGGLGNDTLTLAPGFTGRSAFVLSDLVSNYRGLTPTTGNTAADVIINADNARVNNDGYHRITGFEKLDFVQDGEANNRRQVVTMSAADVNSISETNTLEVRMGQEDVVKATGFANNLGVEGVYNINSSWYDHRYTQTVSGQEVNLYTAGGDRTPEAVSFKTVLSLNQVQIAFDHAMLGTVLAGNFNVTTYSGPTLYAASAVSVNLRQGVSLTLSGQLNTAAKITYTGDLVDESGRSFRHNTWILGTNTGDTLSGADLSTAEQAKGVTIMGGNGLDTITGTSGADLIIGGLGSDSMTGGTGSDTFYFRNEITGSGAAGGLGGTSGDVINDFEFNNIDPSQNDRIDLSQLFETNFKATGNAVTDAAALVNGGFLEVRKVINFQTGKQDLQLWADRDGGGLYGQLVTVSNGGTNLPSEFPAVESNQAFLTRLLEEGRVVVSHF